ncbi:hypothetical protein RDABS01_021890 [Bienertia sinuspersici]
MRVLNFCQKLRYALYPCYSYSISLSDSTTFRAISSTGYSLFPPSSNSLPSNSYVLASFSNGSNSISQYVTNLLISDEQCLRYNFGFRFFSSSIINSSAETCRNIVASEVSNGKINSIIDIIRDDGSDMESRLDSIGSKLSRFALEILHCLNLSKVPALRFYKWFKNAHPSYSCNSDICSLVFANCGFQEDYVGMLSLLKDFRNQRICINKKAFSFLPISSTSMETTKKHVTEVIGVLTYVGGSCCNSGIHSLVEMFCSLSCFDLAKYVVEITERKVSHYNVLVKHLCIRGKFEDARHLLEEMRRLRVDPDAKTYNYMISTLCKQGSINEAFTVFEEMLSRGCFANLITFETLIYFACRYGRSDQAIMFYNQMVCSGVKPRLLTHFAFIRGYFRSQQFDEAYRYASSTDAVDRKDVYTVLASLHIKEGNLLVAYNILVEMLEKGLKPKHSIFVKALRSLRKIGRENFAENLKARYYTQDVG